MGNPDRIRERMEEQKDTEQAIWVSLPVLEDPKRAWLTYLK
jgi:hypothetical protein